MTPFSYVVDWSRCPFPTLNFEAFQIKCKLTSPVTPGVLLQQRKSGCRYGHNQPCHTWYSFNQCSTDRDDVMDTISLATSGTPSNMYCTDQADVMGTLPALLAICEVNDKFPSQRAGDAELMFRLVLTKRWTNDRVACDFWHNVAQERWSSYCTLEAV